MDAEVVCVTHWRTFLVHRVAVGAVPVECWKLLAEEESNIISSSVEQHLGPGGSQVAQLARYHRDEAFFLNLIYQNKNICNFSRRGEVCFQFHLKRGLRWIQLTRLFKSEFRPNTLHSIALWTLYQFFFGYNFIRVAVQSQNVAESVKDCSLPRSIFVNFWLKNSFNHFALKRQVVEHIKGYLMSLITFKFKVIFKNLYGIKCHLTYFLDLKIFKRRLKFKWAHNIPSKKLHFMA